MLAYAPILLERKAKQIRKDMGLSPDDHRHVRTQYESPDRQCVPLTIIMLGVSNTHLLWHTAAGRRLSGRHSHDLSSCSSTSPLSSYWACTYLLCKSFIVFITRC